MKEIRLLILLVSVVFYCEAQAQQPASNEVFYYYYGERIYLSERNDKMLIKLSDMLQKERLLGVIQEDQSLKIADNGTISGKFVVLETKDKSNLALETINKYKGSLDVVSALPMLEYNDGVIQGLSDEFIVKLKTGTTLGQLQNLAAINNCSIVKENSFVPNQFLVSVSKTSALNSLQLANIFYETGLFEFAEPNFFRQNILDSNDPIFELQWNLKNTGQNGGTAGVDIKAEQAWTITQGNANIKVAVVDDGVDLTHPDLIANILPGFDASGNNSSGAPVFSSEIHGTACAGIIAAVKDNGIGISGVAPNCKIKPVHAGDGSSSYPNQWLADGIVWAYQSGADVISNSWSGGSPSTVITNAINAAVSHGRHNDKGCVIVFSSGNKNNPSVPYPSNLPNVIAVGAVDRCGVKAGMSSVAPNSCDPWYYGSNNPGSSYGVALDVVAPWANIPTTDRQGNFGYNTTDYYLFGGTSAACPHVSGVAALILSVNPDLTGQQVRDIIESTAQKVRNTAQPDGLYNYQTTSGHPNGTWHEEMGYGLVDAYAAVLAA
jgi:subtilisin family serine protease